MDSRSIALLCIALFVHVPATAKLACPEMPSLSPATRDVKVEVEGGVGSIGKLKAGELKAKTEVTAKNLVAKYPNIERATLAQMMMATYCSIIDDSPNLTDREKAAMWRDEQKTIMELVIGKTTTTAPPPVTVGIVRSEDLTKSACLGDRRMYRNTMRDKLTFSRRVGEYEVQAITREQDGMHVVKVAYAVNGKRVYPVTKKVALPGKDTLHTAHVRVNGTELTVIYTWDQEEDKTDDEWGVSVLSSLPIRYFRSETQLPSGFEVTGLNPKYETQNQEFANCNFAAGNKAIVECNAPLNNRINTPKSLYWTWTLWDAC